MRATSERISRLRSSISVERVLAAQAGPQVSDRKDSSMGGRKHWSDTARRIERTSTRNASSTGLTIPINPTRFRINRRRATDGGYVEAWTAHLLRGSGAAYSC